MTWYLQASYTPSGPVAAGAVGNGWADPTSSWSVNASNVLLSGSGYLFRSAAVESQVDGRAQIRFTVSSPAYSMRPELFFRQTGSLTSPSGIYVEYNPGGAIDLYESTAGSFGAHQGAGPPAMAAGLDYDVQMDCVQTDSTHTTITVTTFSVPSSGAALCSGTQLYTTSFTVTNAALQNVSGQIGLHGSGTGVAFKQFASFTDVGTPATALTWSPGSATVHPSAATSFTVAANGTLSASATVALSDGGAGGTFSPTSLSFSSTTTSATVSYTPPATLGSITLTASAAGLSSGTTALSNTPPPSVACVPTSFPLGVATPFTLTGTSTSWTAGTKPTVAGGTNAYVSNMALSGQVLTGTLNPGTAAGTLTMGNSTDSVTTTVSAVANVVNNIVWHGDSLTAGVAGSNSGTTAATRLAVVFKALGPTWQGSNQGNGGHTLVQMLSELNSTINGLYDATKKQNILIAQGGHNDIGGGGASAATVINSIKSYIAAALAAHPWKIVWCTQPPAAFPGAYPANFDSIRNTVNAYMRLNWQSMGIAALSDFAMDARTGLDGCEYNSAYFSGSDFTHFNDAGYTIWGQYDLAAVAAAAGTVKRWTRS